MRIHPVKRFITILLIGLIVLCIVASVAWGVVCVMDYQSIINDPAASGIDYLFGFVYALGFAFAGIVGFVAALILPKMTVRPILTSGAYICAILFALEVLISAGLALL